MQGFRKHIKELANSEFYRNIAGLFSGIFAARLIPALFALLIARIYAPSEFGNFLLFLSIASLISILATGGYERAILLAGNTGQKQQIFSFSLKLNMVVSLLALLIIAAGLYLGIISREYSAMVLLIPAYSFFFGSVQLLRNILISNKNFRKLSLLEVIRALATGILQSLFFVIPETGLFLGITLAQIITFFIYCRTLDETKGFAIRWFEASEKALAQRYINFPRFSVPGEMLNFLSSQLPVFLIKPFFGETLLGLYSFSHRYVSIPVQLTSISIGSVYVQKAQSLRKNPQELGKLTYDLYRKQFLLAIIPFTLLALWGREIFAFVFGPGWDYSGTISQLIAPWLFAVFIGSPLSTILIVMEKQNISMVFNLLLLVFRAASLVAGALILKDITFTIALYSLTGFLFFGALTVFSLQMASVNLFRVLRFSAGVLLVTTVPLLLLRLWL